MEAVLPRAWRRDSPWHGETHWRCVAATGLALDEAAPGADRGLVFCFGLLHDTRRENETFDPGHGARAEAFARELRDEGALELDDVALRPPRRGAQAPLRRPGLDRRDDRRVLGRRPAPPPARLHPARPEALLDRASPTARRRSRRPPGSGTRDLRPGRRSWASRSAEPSPAACVRVRAAAAGRASHIRHEAGTDTAHVRVHAGGMDERTGSEPESVPKGDALPPEVARAAGAGAAGAEAAARCRAGGGHVAAHVDRPPRRSGGDGPDDRPARRGRARRGRHGRRRGALRPALRAGDAAVPHAGAGDGGDSSAEGR